MNRDAVKEIIVRAIYADCGGDDCGAEEFHEANAEDVLTYLAHTGIMLMWAGQQIEGT